MGGIDCALRDVGWSFQGVRMESRVYGLAGLRDGTDLAAGCVKLPTSAAQGEDKRARNTEGYSKPRPRRHGGLQS
jgi:hypothetical protein